MSPIWRIELFGQPRVVGSGLVIDRFESRRAVALLAFLALHSETRHPREVLADRIWPDAPIDNARNRLKQALASLRRQLEPPGVQTGSVLVADRLSIGLREGSFVCDVDEFRDCVAMGDFAKARTLRRGELLPGFYDEWLEDLRLALSALEVDLVDFGPDPVTLPSVKPPDQVKVIPFPITSFVGREEESKFVLDRLQDSRLVTVTGIGGIGKTRLTLYVGEKWAQSDVWFVPLADTESASQFLPLIARTMGLEASASSDPILSIQSALLDRPALLILDNLEHLAGDQCREALSRLLSQVPTVRILVSSRMPIGVQGEAEVQLWPLEIPEESSDLSLIASSPSVKLFIERARQTRPDFQLTNGNVKDLVGVCRQLEGVPLAIELCATWAHFGTGRVLERLESVTKLESRRRDVPERHRSLEQVFKSTCSTLSEEARTLLGKLSVYRGGWGWDLLFATCGNGASIDALSELVEASLIRPVYASEPPRFTMIESLRQFSESLLDPPAKQEIEDRLIDVFCTLASQSRSIEVLEEWGILGQGGWIRFWEGEWPNLLRVASLLNQRGNSQRLQQLALDTEWYWSVYAADLTVCQLACSSGQDTFAAAILKASYEHAQSLDDVVDRAFQSALELAEDERDRAECHFRWAKFWILRQKMESVRAHAEQALDSFTRLKDDTGRAQCLHILGNCAIQEGDNVRAETELAESDRLFQLCGHKINAAAVAYTRARHRYMLKDMEGALQVLFQCRDLGRDLRNMRFMARTANLFGVVLRNLKQEKAARVYLLLALRASKSIHDHRAAHIPLWNIYLSLATEQRWEDAVVCMALSMSLWRQYFQRGLEPGDQLLLDGFLRSANQALGPHKFAHLECVGGGMSLDEADRFVTRAIDQELTLFADEAREFFEPQFP